MSNKTVQHKFRKIEINGLLDAFRRDRSEKKSRTHEEQMEYMRRKNQKSMVNPLFFWSNY